MENQSLPTPAAEEPIITISDGKKLNPALPNVMISEEVVLSGQSNMLKCRYARGLGKSISITNGAEAAEPCGYPGYSKSKKQLQLRPPRMQSTMDGSHSLCP